MKFNSLFGGLIALIGLAFLAGCGGGGGTAPEPIQGSFYGGRIFLEKNRGGGESIQIMGTAIDWVHRNFSAEIVFFYPPSTTNSTLGTIEGDISKEGIVTATVELIGGRKIFIDGGPLRWKSNRGGSSRTLSGPVNVSYSPAEGVQVLYPDSTFELYQ